MKELGRRGFFKTSIAYGAAVAAYFVGKGAGEVFWKFRADVKNLNYLDNLKPPPHPLPPELTGLTINSPFLYERDAGYISRVVSRAKEFGAKNIRIFMSDSLENPVGLYNDKILTDIKNLAGNLRGLNLIVSLFDSFNLLHKDDFNIDYPAAEPTSPYYFAADGNSKEEKQLEFFTSPQIRAAIDERFAHIVSTLNIKEIAAWEVANELEVPVLSRKDSQKLLTGWYQEKIATIRKLDKNRPIITGLAKPWLIDETKFEGQNIINSFHAYPLQPWVLKGLTEFINSSRLPLAGLEIGVGQNLKSVIDLPTFLYTTVQCLISKNTLYSNGFGLWKMDKWTDGYDITSESPQYLKRLSEKLVVI